MKIVVFGSTGITGLSLLDIALSQKDEVITVARRPQAIQIESPNLKIIKAEISNHQALQDAIEGADVVISVLGVSSLLQARKGTKIYSEGTKAILNAMQQVGCHRLIVVSSGGLEPQPSDPWFYTHILKKFFLEPIYQDMRIMEKLLSEQQSVQYTIVRPPFLYGDQKKLDYRVSIGRCFSDDSTLSRWSLAHYLYQTAKQNDPNLINQKVWLSN
jgi:putative NADH-flavin reductase